MLKNQPFLDGDERRSRVVKARYLRERVVANEYHERGRRGKPSALLHFVVHGLEYMNWGLRTVRVVAQLEAARALHIEFKAEPMVVLARVRATTAAGEKHREHCYA